MHTRLVSYLRDNRDHIIENWLTEAEVPAPQNNQPDNTQAGVVPYAFFSAAFDSIIQRIALGIEAKNESELMHFNAFLGITCDCKERCFGGRVCMELHDSGLSAFMRVFDEDWDTGHEFNQLDRECSKDLINHALSDFFGREIKLCAKRTLRDDCPFSAQI